MQHIEACLVVLWESRNTPLHYFDDITNRILTRKYCSFKETPAQSLRSEMGSNPNLFKMVGDGLYEINKQSDARVILRRVVKAHYDDRNGYRFRELQCLNLDNINEPYVIPTETNTKPAEPPKLSQRPLIPTYLTFKEGATYEATIRKYERDPKAKELCLRHYKIPKCQACGIIFKDHYGEHAEGLIQVHHIVPVSQKGGTYLLNPVADLIPLCPNCHAVVHFRHSNELKWQDVAQLYKLHKTKSTQ
ncbi:MAG: putative endonuclease [Planctomycetaceae bacterium]|nr:putative endonuclease [Planctomycetaceae bacterium]